MASPDEVWLVDFGDPFPGEPAHHRPALIIGPSRLFGDNLPFVIVAPMTPAQRRLSFHVEIEPDASNGLYVTSYVQCELIRSVSKRRLRSMIGSVSQTSAEQVETVIRRLLGY